jgi:hypothetical protein
MGARMSWIAFFDTNTKAAVNVFSTTPTPYISLVVNPFHGTHDFSIDGRSRDALAVLHDKFDACTYPQTQYRCIVRHPRVFKLEVTLYDSDSAVMTTADVDHVFMLEIETQCDNHQASGMLDWGK